MAGRRNRNPEVGKELPKIPRTPFGKLEAATFAFSDAASTLQARNYHGTQKDYQIDSKTICVVGDRDRGGVKSPKIRGGVKILNFRGP